MFVGQDRLECASVKRMRLPMNAGGFDATPTLLRSPMAFLAQHLAIASSVAKSTGLLALETLGLVEAARGAQEKLRHMGQSVDDSAPINTAHTAQYSLFTSAERIARAWLKNCSVIFAHLKRVCHLVRTCLTLCCLLTCHAPRAHLLPHSLFLPPRHQKTHFNQNNTICSKNTHCIINLSKNDQSKSIPFKNHSGVKTSRVAENCATRSPQSVDERAMS